MASVNAIAAQEKSTKGAEGALVSVIVPVYNTAPYLAQCLDSILGQTLRDIEIICVDDGSTDNSWEILSCYAAEDSRIILLQQANLFAGVARNAAMDIARGRYLVFWDSDDFFEPEALAAMYKCCERTNADICVCGANQYFQDVEEAVPHDKYLVRSRVPEEDTFNRFTNSDYLFSFTTVMIWNKMYRRSFLEQYGLRFQPRRNSNDVYFSLCALGTAHRIAVVYEHLINYRIGRADGLVNTLSKDPTATAESMADAREYLSAFEGFPDYDFFFKAVSVLRHSIRQLKGGDGWPLLKRYLCKGGLRRLGLSRRPLRYYLGWVSWFFTRNK